MLQELGAFSEGPCGDGVTPVLITEIGQGDLLQPAAYRPEAGLEHTNVFCQPEVRSMMLRAW